MVIYIYDMEIMWLFYPLRFLATFQIYFEEICTHNLTKNMQCPCSWFVYFCVECSLDHVHQIPHQVHVCRWRGEGRGREGDMSPQYTITAEATIHLTPQQGGGHSILDWQCLMLGWISGTNPGSSFWKFNLEAKIWNFSTDNCLEAEMATAICIIQCAFVTCIICTFTSDWNIEQSLFLDNILHMQEW